MCPRKFGEFEEEIGPRCDIDSLKNVHSLSTIDDFANDRATKLGLFVHVDTDAVCHVSEIGDATKTNAQVSPN
jgi:hypothetical protein